MNRTRLIIYNIAAIFLVPGALAQTANPAGAAADTPNIESGHPPPTHANNADQLFIKEFSLGGMAELDYAKLAARQAQNSHVKEFAKRMTDDHSRANDKLRPLEKSHDVPRRQGFDMDHRVVRDELAKLSGTAFDVAYIRSQVREHQRAAGLLTWEIGSGQDETIRAYAQQTLPTVMEHLQLAQQLQAELTGSATRM